MIPATELRLGNLVIDARDSQSHLLSKVMAIGSSELIELEYLNSGYSSQYRNRITPIPLTEEWLMKAGFVNGELVIGDLSFYINLDSDNAIIEMHEVYDAYIRIKRPQYLHQLQNLIFALCGEELSINP